MANLNFNAASVTPDVAFDPLPPDWYPAVLEKSEIKPTKNNAVDGGYYLACTFNILGPDPQKHKGRKAFVNLNLKNSNAQAQEIAYRQLSAICHAVGIIQCENSEQLHNIPLAIKLKVTPAADGYDARNDIAGYKNISEYTGPSNAGANQAPAGFNGGAPAGFGNGQQVQQNTNFAPQNTQFQQPVQQQQPTQQFQHDQNQGQQQNNGGGQPNQQNWQQPAGEQPWNQAGNNQQAQQQPVQQQTDWTQQQPVQQGNQGQQQAVQQQPDQFGNAAQNAQASKPPWAQ